MKLPVRDLQPTTDARAGRAILPSPPAWYDDALCAQLGFTADEFYPEKGANPNHAKAMCRMCPVRVECLQYALANEEQHGVWGATTPDERLAIRKASAA